MLHTDSDFPAANFLLFTSTELLFMQYQIAIELEMAYLHHYIHRELDAVIHYE
jgi:hypothetical protein